MEPAPFYKFFAGIGSTNATCLAFFLFLAVAQSLLISVFRFISHSLAYLVSPLFLSGFHWFQVTRFFWEITRPKSWPDKVSCSSHLQSHKDFLLSYSYFFSLGLKTNYFIKNLCYTDAPSLSTKKSVFLD